MDRLLAPRESPQIKSEKQVGNSHATQFNHVLLDINKVCSIHLRKFEEK